MDLLARLQRLQGAGPLAHGAPPAPRPPPAAVPALQVPDTVVDAQASVGAERPLDARTAAARTLARLALDPGLHGVEPARALLLDTETTGLAGGAGTLPFLIGLAWFEDASLRVRQLFLGQPGAERPLLEELAARLRTASVLVTFNGKSFDWPLLRTRFVLNRLPPPPLPPHLDLLHCARRVFKRRPEASRLKQLEVSVLGFERHGDIDGALIPAVYFDWLRRGARGLLDQVFAHNAQDVVSMAAVLAALCRRVEAPEAHDHAPDCLSVAELALRAGDEAEAARFALAAAQRAACPAVGTEARLLLARLALRRREAHAAREHLEGAMALREVPEALRLQVHLALARLCEHRLKDPGAALRHAEAGARGEGPLASARRLERLRARAAAS